MTGYLCSHDSTDCGPSIHNGHVRLAAGFTYALSSGVSCGHRRVRRTTSVRFKSGFAVFPPGEVFAHYGHLDPHAED